MKTNKMKLNRTKYALFGLLLWKYLHPFLEWCILCSSKHPIRRGHRKSHIVLGTNHNYIHRKYEPKCMVWRTNRKSRIFHRLFHTTGQWLERQEKDISAIVGKHTIQNVHIQLNLLMKINGFQLYSPTPGCLRQKIKSGWCLAILIQLELCRVF